MVPALYEQDEKDALMNTVRQDVRAAGIPETPDNLWNFYVSKCRNNLHIVLAMSPSSSKLRVRCRNFPGLVSNAVIDWFFPWPADALQKVAEFFLADEELPEEHRAAVVSHLVFTHQNVTIAGAPCSSRAVQAMLCPCPSLTATQTPQQRGLLRSFDGSTM